MEAGLDADVETEDDKDAVAGMERERDRDDESEGEARDRDGDCDSVRLEDRVALADTEGESDTVTGESSRILFAMTSETIMSPLALLAMPSRPTNDAFRPSTDPVAPFPAISVTASVVTLML